MAEPIELKFSLNTLPQPKNYPEIPIFAIFFTQIVTE